MAFIVFEGLDGSGKSTLINSFQQYLQNQKVESIVTREPGGTPLGEEIRELLLRQRSSTPVPRAELLLYQAARAQHVAQVILPYLQRGQWVLCDRFTPSTVAFQVGGRSLPFEEVNRLNEYATAGVSPHLVVLLDIPVSESLRRLRHREEQLGLEKDRFEQEEASFHERVRESYLDQAREASSLKSSSSKPSSPWEIIDALLPAEKLLHQLIKCLEKYQWFASLNK